MKTLSAIGLVGLLVALAVAKNLPLRGRSFGNFGPQVQKTFKVFNAEEQITLREENPVAAAVEFFLRKTNSASQPQIASSHTTGHNGVTHVYLQQIVNGIQVVNGVGNVNVGPKGQILSLGSSFFQGHAPSQALRPQHSAQNAQIALGKLLRNKSLPQLSSEFPPTLKYIQVNNGQELSLAWDIVVETKDNMYNAIVDATTNEVVQLIDWVSDASYNVFPLGINDPHSGDRVIVEDPAHLPASPLGWHAQSDTIQSAFTIGNNVYAQENLDGGSDYLDNYRPDGGDDLHFDHPLDLTQQPEQYLDAAITNLFYWNNIIHDIFYVYGFDEASGNFQENNFGLGGREEDAVYAQAQDGSGTNNANFMTPPDGAKGRMRMYIWTVTNPHRDGDLDGGIVMHEYLHGISNRLTGGPTNVNCLGFGEPGGMGEGWGDIFATITRVTEDTTRDQDYQMGDYSNGGSGIRKFPYSTSLETNPSTYNYVVRIGYGGVHAKGEVWAVIIYEVFWNLVEKHGFDPDWFNNNPEDVKTEGTYKSIINGKVLPRPQRKATLGGNVIMFQLLVDGMMLQPCSPTFVEARDAIIEADEINNNGENACELWRGFAKRGLGTGARYEGVENFDVPAECES